MKVPKLSAAFVFLLGFFPFNLNAEPETIKIGAVLHLTGEYAMQGEAFREGVELAIDSLNDSAKDDGRRFAAVYEDTQYKPMLAHSAARKLAATKDVAGTVISTVTEGKAGGKIFEQARLPAIVLWDSSPELEEIGEYVFGIGPWAPASGEESAKFAFDRLKARKVSIINTNTEWSVYVSDHFEKKFSELGGKILSRQQVDPSETDFRTIFTKSKNGSPDAYYVPSDSNILPFFRQLKEAGISAPLVTSDILDAELFESGGDLFEGVYQSQTGDPMYPETQKLTEAYKKKYNKEPDFLLFTAWAYDAVRLIGLAAAKDNGSRETVKNELYKVKDFPGACGLITFNQKGSSPREVKIFQVKNRELVPAQK